MARLHALAQSREERSGHTSRTNRQAPASRPLPLVPGSILYLQRTIGNQAVRRMLGGARPVIQRKVGLELEIAADLRKQKGTAPLKKPSTSARSDKKAGEKSQLLTKDREEAVEKSTTMDSITKGETITSGAGWRLTPDGHTGDWYPEFITDAFDETKDYNGIVDAVASVKDYVDRTFQPVLTTGLYAELPRKFEVGWPDSMTTRSLNANIHITGGVRRDQVVLLLKHLSAADSRGRVRPKASALLRQAVASAETTGPDKTYQGLVALLANYISGQRLALAQVDPTEIRKQFDFIADNTMDREDARKYGRLADSVRLDDDVLLYLLEKRVSKKAEGLAGKVYSEFKDPLGQFYQELGEALSGAAPTAAKINVPVPSRTSLNEMVSHVQQMPPLDTFVGHVTAAAGTVDPGAPLFPLGLQRQSNPGRTIEVNPGITVRQWLQTVRNGQNLTWSENVFHVEEVGPKIDTKCCFWEVRAEGVVIELRDTGKSVKPDNWWFLADEMRQLFRHFNNPDNL